MNKAVIFDRDGVINDHRHYVNTVDDFFVFSKAYEAIRMATDHGYLALVATNQGGVGLGYMSAETVTEIHAYMGRTLAARGAHITDVAVCMHAPQDHCTCRKPKPGLLFELQRKHNLNLGQSYMVGDRETDVLAGMAAGTKTVLIGKRPSGADFVATDILDAVRQIVRQKS